MNRPIDRAIAKTQLERINEALQEPHLLIGGLAVQQYHTARDSKDIDLVCDFETARSLLDELYPSIDWDVRDEKQSEYRPSFQITHKFQDFGTIIFGPKISERAPYAHIDWNALKQGAEPFQYENRPLKNILVPTPHALAYTKFISFLSRQSPPKKIEADLKDFVDLTNGQRFSVSLFYSLLRKTDAHDALMNTFREKCAGHLAVLETSCLYHLAAMFVMAPKGRERGHGAISTNSAAAALPEPAIGAVPTEITEAQILGAATGPLVAAASVAAGAASAVTPPETSAPEAALTSATSASIAQEEPEQQEFWSLYSDYYSAMTERRQEEGVKLFERLLPLVKDDVSRERIRVRHVELKYLATGSIGDILTLEEATADKDNGDMALGALARIALMGHDYRGAIDKFCAAAGAAADPSVSFSYILDAAKVHQELGELAAARRLLTGAMNGDGRRDLRHSVLTALADIYDFPDDKRIRAALLAQAARLSPADVKVCFDASFSLAESSMPHLALMQYATLLKFEPKNAAALNNIGLLCSELDMSAKAAEYLHRGHEANDSLATANLAQRYLTAGFLDQAENLLAVARKRENAHEDVGGVLSRLSNRRKSEEEAWRAAIKVAVRESLFLSDFAGAFLVPDAEEAFLVPWEMSAGKIIQFKQSTGQLVAEVGDKEHRKRFMLQATGRAATCASLNWDKYLNQFKESRTGYAYLLPDLTEMNVLWINGTDSSKVTWRAKPVVGSLQVDAAQQPATPDGAPSLAPLDTAPRG
ncbi:hypothetical protein BE21_55025 [Sorangium cellulosum]|uniref:Uncharacterized protein n=1 Tax=Sorangium cellulosum TaxID=56 RepID=A0A150TCE8_SORCE|nr:hypothetical protein BE21_55025 [Sorangium cellulosum]